MASKINLKPEEVGVYAIGGLGEIGKNTYGIEYQDEIIIVDAGIKFPEDDLLGIDYVIPDYSYIVENVDRVKALVITHGHEDHIGGIPFLLKQANIPIYAGPLALALIKGKLEEHGLLRDAQLYEINANTELTFKNMSVTFFRTTHSIPEPLGIVIHTPQGKIVCTGDFKFDFTPVGEPADLHRMAALGEEGVLCLLSDSTNAEVPTFTNSEKVVGQSIMKIIEGIHGRIIFASFASNIFRLQQAAEAAVKTGRKIVVFGRSMEKAIVNGVELGYIKVPKGTIIDPSEMKNYHASEILIMCTGSQGEPLSALARMANGEHKSLSIRPQDTVIISATPVPGNEKSVQSIINALSKIGCEIYDKSKALVHVSGHGSQEELKLMLGMARPKNFMPVHGEAVHLRAHAELAQQMGVPANRIFILDNGDTLEMRNGKVTRGKTVESGVVYVDGLSVTDANPVVLRDRQRLSQDGIVTAVVTLVGRNLKPGVVEISGRGVSFADDDELMNDAQNLVRNSIEKASKSEGANIEAMRKSVRNALSNFLWSKTRTRPMVIPVIMEV